VLSVRPLGRSELSALLDSHGLRPSRALGQNFLADPNLAERIARLARVGPGDRVVEVGAGLGSLTTALAATGAHVLALEIDRYLVPVLRQVVEPLGVTVVEADAMHCDWSELLGSAPGAPGTGQAPAGAGEAPAGACEAPVGTGGGFVLVANLPYNIATPLILDLLSGVEVIDRMLVMVQREVGERLVAAPRTPAYGAVSARVAYFATARVAARVPASVFIPRPNVESVLVEIERRDAPAVPEETASYGEIDRLLRAGFSTRRKMLRRSLAGMVDEAAFAAAGVDSSRRPEELALSEWGRLAEAVRLGAGGVR
jgi:16S rRNA (adenine1518-N6/adenine1519-N6)-dimethyltransferase